MLNTKTESTPAIMIDIAKYSIGVISGKEVKPGTRVDISLKYIDDYAVQGTVKWLEEIQEILNYLYRMDIEADNVLFLKEISDVGLPERSEYVKWLISSRINNEASSTGQGLGAIQNDIEVPEKRPVISVLVVDDEEVIRNLFKEALEKFGYQVTVAADGDEGLRLLRANPADLVITDIFMPKKNGHTLIIDITREFPEVNIFAITGKKSIKPGWELDIATTLGAVRVFRKPTKIYSLLDAIKKLAA
jgi:CheY-like chemotaxis protein